ncbi:unnamed protein product [Protopolystoma xenopodis]|uniref:Uncharacterized protein n=1 Tax=Protopolystoma xenopodis TaxID=117903 RepID=A0A3S5B592_9PLAT|nr:unnamed protein product [Protopolystoma xenopodis]
MLTNQPGLEGGGGRSLGQCDLFPCRPQRADDCKDVPPVKSASRRMQRWDEERLAKEEVNRRTDLGVRQHDQSSGYQSDPAPQRSRGLEGVSEVGGGRPGTG